MSEKHRITSTMQNLIGDSNNSHDTDTIFGKLNQILEHFHKPGLVYPSLANSIQITSGNGVWLLGNATTIIPINTITSDYDIHYIFVAAMQFQNDEYQINLYRTDNDTLVTQTKIRSTTIVMSANRAFAMTPIIPANVGVYAKSATSSPGDGTISISLYYHTY